MKSKQIDPEQAEFVIDGVHDLVKKGAKGKIPYAVVADAKANPLRPRPGRPKKGEEKGADGTIKHGTNCASTLARRLLRDAPEIFARLESGEFKSVRAAAIAAGIVKPPTPLQVAQRAFRKLTSEEREEFVSWMKKEAGESDGMDPDTEGPGSFA